MTCSDVEGDGIWWCCQGDGIKFRAEIMYTAGLNGRVKLKTLELEFDDLIIVVLGIEELYGG